jgi:hypothetical protein
MARHGVSNAERKRIAEALERAARSGERDAVRIVREVYESIRHLPPDEAVRVLREAMGPAADRLSATIVAGMEEAARMGARGAVRQLGMSASSGGASGGAGGGATGAAGATGMGGGWEEAARFAETGGLKIRRLGAPMGRDFLSPHLHRQGMEMVRKMEGAFGQVIREGESAMELARRMRDIEGQRIWVTQPGVVDDFEMATRRMMTSTSDPRSLAEYFDKRKEYRRYIRKLSSTAGDMGLRAAHQHAFEQLERAIRSGKADAIERAKKWLAYDQQAYRQRVIARTQIGRAYTQGFIDNADVPWVVGMQWNVETGSGRKRDICDILGNQNLHGMGPGVYPMDKLPDLPAHPNCNCYFTEFIDDSLDEGDTRPPAPPERANADAAWLRTQPAETQAAILGQERYRLFRESGFRVVPPAPLQRRPEPTLRRATRGPSYEEASAR